ncbi:hypothetical protein SDC9_209619 [bioreactor metagenome]|uniref:Uncharacterized protein n=1 Tax=bioreactor metagenome TaxID=1076179 RepID=A0A645JNG6_9ZZZZ
MLIGHSPQYIILIEPFEQCRELGVSTLGRIQLSLQSGNLPAKLHGVFAVDILCKEGFFLSGKMGHSAQVIKDNMNQVLLTNVVRGANIFTFFLIGVAHKIIFDGIHCMCPMQHKRLTAVDAKHQSRE